MLRVVTIATVAVALAHLAQGQDETFVKLPFNDVTFTADLLFDVTAGSEIDCGRECTTHDGCVTYTFTQGSANQGTCRGHTSRMHGGSVTSAAPAPTRAFEVYLGVNEVEHESCFTVSYTVLDDPWRNSSLYHGSVSPRCDRDTWVPGWYRFLLNGLNGVIPSTCVERYYCGTHVTMTLNLQGTPLPAVGQDLETITCGGWDVGCCTALFGSAQPVTVRNCGPFYIYYLVAPAGCSTCYCVEPQ